MKEMEKFESGRSIRIYTDEGRKYYNMEREVLDCSDVDFSNENLYLCESFFDLEAYGEKSEEK